jgi:hypothetical protein
MADRLTLTEIQDGADLARQTYEALKELAKREPKNAFGTGSPLDNCCAILIEGGAVAMIIQTRVHDPDFLAEFGAYYSRQFNDVPRFCTRLHFFSQPVSAGNNVFEYLDHVGTSKYLGFITLRPIIKSPVGASIISGQLAPGIVRSADKFPVHLGGVEFYVEGTPFMQQDNAVGACAQASIWMSLRTLRKREGDRAHDPAQITDAATKYFVSSRTRPNREGLTQQQMVEAIRAAGYAPHSIRLGSWWGSNRTEMDDTELAQSRQVIHTYVESAMPVVLIVFPPSGGHAIVVLGVSWMSDPQSYIYVQVRLHDGSISKFKHAVSWSPSFIIHNDNTGPYQEMTDRADLLKYSFQHGAIAIPLLPVDIFMSGEEAFTVGAELLASVFQSLKQVINNESEFEKLTESLALRLRLVEKRKLRKWGAEANVMVPELRESLRLMDLPKRVWMLEIHKAEEYGKVGVEAPYSLLGLVLIDPTADMPELSYLAAHFNLRELGNLPNGVLVTWEMETGLPKAGIQTDDAGPMQVF